MQRNSDRMRPATLASREQSERNVGRGHTIQQRSQDFEIELTDAQRYHGNNPRSSPQQQLEEPLLPATPQSRRDPDSNGGLLNDEDTLDNRGRNRARNHRRNSTEEANNNVHQTPIDAPWPQNLDFDYEPIETSEAVELGYPKLDFKPLTIRTWFFALTLAFFAACIGGIVALIYKAGPNDQYHVHTSRNHLAFRYVPAAIGTLTTIWFRAIVSALARITPYISMSTRDKIGDRGHRGRRTLQNVYASEVFDPTNVMGVANNGHWLLFASLLVQFLIMLTLVPLKAAFVQITPNNTGWNVVVLHKIGYALIAVYSCLIFVTSWMLVRLWSRETGLKWDAVAVADQIALVQGSNVLPLFDGLEFANPKTCKTILNARTPDFGTLRLGYWKHKGTQHIWHGLACLQLPQGKSNSASSLSSHQRRQPGHGEESHQPRVNNMTSNMYSEYGQSCMPKSALYRYRSALWILEDGPLAIWMTTLILLITLTTIGFIKHRVQDGFEGRLKVYDQSAELDDLGLPKYTLTIAFVYHYLPVFILNIYSSIWVIADVFYRFTMPFATMSDGSLASTSILLDYTAALPVLITIQAFMNGHWKVAICSALSLAATIPPIIATGIFVNNPTPTGSAIGIDPINFWAVFVLLIIYLPLFVILRPSSRYRLPRVVRTLSDVLSYCYASKLLDDVAPDQKPVFSAQEKDEKRIHMESRIHLVKKLYQFGLYVGKDNEEHLGFDVSVRDDDNGRPVEVVKFDPGRGIRGFGLWWFWKKPSILRPTV